MKAYRALSFALAIVAVTTLAFGSIAFSSASVERPMSVSVVDDSEAYVGVEACAVPSARGGNESANGSASPVRVWVSNRYDGPLALASVTSEDAARKPGKSVAGETVTVGETRWVDVVFDGSVESVTVAIEGDGMDATITRDVVPSSACDHAVTGSTTSDGNGADDSTG